MFGNDEIENGKTFSVNVCRHTRKKITGKFFSGYIFEYFQIRRVPAFSGKIIYCQRTNTIEMKINANIINTRVEFV